jgi:hypothetical protein
VIVGDNVALVIPNKARTQGYLRARVKSTPVRMEPGRGSFDHLDADDGGVDGLVHNFQVVLKGRKIAGTTGAFPGQPAAGRGR